jgi:hypothetical protein
MAHVIFWSAEIHGEKRETDMCPDQQGGFHKRPGCKMGFGFVVCKVAVPSTMF